MRRRLLLLPVAALLAVLAFVARPERAPSAARFSDREIFEGALFGVGPVATLLPEARDQLRPELYARNADELASMSAARAALIARIESTQPGLIGEFARVARSGDPAAIRSMLERAAEAVNAAGRTEAPGGTLYANVPDGPRFPGPSRPRPVAPQNETQPLYANVPDGPRFPGPSRPRPVAPQNETQPLYANVPDGPRFPGPSRPRPVSPQNETQPLFANVPDGPRFPGPSRPRPVAPQNETQPLYANVPDGPRFPGPSRPRPVAPQNETQPLYANVPDGPRFPGPSRPRPIAPQSETALGSLTTDPVSAQPAWAFFGSQLFSEQLAASMARTLEHSAASGG